MDITDRGISEPKFGPFIPRSVMMPSLSLQAVNSMIIGAKCVYY